MCLPYLSLGYIGSILIGLLFHGAVLMDSHPTDKSEDTLESGSPGKDLVS